MAVVILYYFCIVCGLVWMNCEGNDDTKRLYHDLLAVKKYNKLVRPIGNQTNRPLTIRMGIRLSQIIDVDELNQVMTTNVWVRQEWYDYNLKWNPFDYGGLDRLYIPSESLWIPDIVLYNNADGQFEVQLRTKATVLYTGLIIWEPPAIYKSSCIMDVEFFPFDTQKCSLKFGSWTYDGFEVDLVHLCAENDEFTGVIQNGIDFREFYQNVEWDIVAATAQKNIKQYICCIEPYPDLTFTITMRRKTLFHTVNLIFPCVAISLLTVLVFYLPSDSEEKISLCISVLLALTVFFLLLTEIIPPTSIVIPLIGKYLLFTMILVTLSIMVTVFTLAIHFRSPTTHIMSAWTKTVFLRVLPNMLLMQRPVKRICITKMKTLGTASINTEADVNETSLATCNECNIKCENRAGVNSSKCSTVGKTYNVPDSVNCALEDAQLICVHLKREDLYTSVVEDWKFAAMVLDRLFFLLFTSASLIGTIGIILQSPTIYDDRAALTAETAQFGLC